MTWGKGGWKLEKTKCMRIYFMLLFRSLFILFAMSSFIFFLIHAWQIYGFVWEFFVLQIDGKTFRKLKRQISGSARKFFKRFMIMSYLCYVRLAKLSGLPYLYSRQSFEQIRHCDHVLWSNEILWIQICVYMLVCVRNFYSRYHFTGAWVKLIIRHLENLRENLSMLIPDYPPPNRQKLRNVFPDRIYSCNLWHDLIDVTTRGISIRDEN